MDSIAKTLNAQKEVTLDGKVYQLSSVTLNDLAAYEVHLKRDMIKTITSLDIPKTEIYKMVSEINREGIDTDELVKRINSISGVIFLVWRCVSKHDKEITIEEIGDKLDMENMNDVIDVALDAAGESEGEQGEKKHPST